jgi:hypothetical protein
MTAINNGLGVDSRAAEAASRADAGAKGFAALDPPTGYFPRTAMCSA